MSWIPLESNPDVMNTFIHKLGCSGYSFTDVFGLDEECLSFVQGDVAAVLFLFPITPKYEEFRAREEASLKHQPNVYFIRQKIANACGTIGLLHALANNADKMALESPLSDFLQSTMDLNADERADLLESDSRFASFISSIHLESSLQGQTEAPPAEDDVDLHFIAFVQVNEVVYECDGRKPFPVCHGPGPLLKTSARVIQSFMDRDPGLSSFTVMALAQ